MLSGKKAVTGDTGAREGYHRWIGIWVFEHRELGEHSIMKRCDVYDALHVHNYAALMIAVCYPQRVNAEDVFKLYETGTRTGGATAAYG